MYVWNVLLVLAIQRFWEFRGELQWWNNLGGLKLSRETSAEEIKLLNKTLPKFIVITLCKEQKHEDSRFSQTNIKTFSWWKLKQIQTRNKITVYIKSGKYVSGNLKFFVDFFFFSPGPCSFLMKIGLQNDLKLQQEQGSAWPALI